MVARGQISLPRMILNINSLRSAITRPFNGNMKIKSLLSLVLAVNLLLALPLFGQTVEITGKVLAVSSTVVTVQSGTDVWDIKRTQTTIVTGTLKVGALVTIKYNAPDGQKKEGPTNSNPTATPTSG
jgi:hypothetical protein